MIVLSLFDYSANFVRPWAEAGFLCYCVDLQHPPGQTRQGNIIRIGVDVLNYLPPRSQYAFCAAFPPCTHLAVSGARWFRGKGLGQLAESIRLFHKAALLCEWTGAPYFIENPVSTISTYWRPPDQTFDPCDYGDPWTKKTCLWTGGGFRMPPKNRVTPILGSRMHRIPPGADRANLRSETPANFARAVFAANHDPGQIPDFGYPSVTKLDNHAGRFANQSGNNSATSGSQIGNTFLHSDDEEGSVRVA